METFNDLNRPPAGHPRNPWIAGGLSFVLPGLGQVYNGQWLKCGMAALGLGLLVPVLMGITRLGTTFNGMVAFVAIVLLLRLWLIIDAIMEARKRQVYVLGRYEGWPAVVVAGGLILLLGFVIDPKALMKTESFVIPTASSEPTIQVGDQVMVDMWAYRKSDPDYGHLIAFKDSRQQMLLYRVVGLPGDRISYVDNVLKINEEIQNRTTIGESQYEGMPIIEFEEELPNGTRHRGYMLKGKPTYSDLRLEGEELVIPEDEYYVLGDFRDNAQDSRFLGTISRQQIHGRVRYSWWGTSMDRIGIDFTK